MDILDRENALRDMIDDLVKRGYSVKEAVSIIKNNLESAGRDYSSRLTHILGQKGGK